MNPISKNEILKLLQKDYLENCCTMLEIESGGTEFYLSQSNKNDYLIKYEFGEIPFYEICTTDRDFFKKCIQHINKTNLGTVKLSVTDKKFLTNHHLTSMYNVEDVSYYYDLRLLRDPCELAEKMFIRKLTRDDRSLAESVICEPAQGRPPFIFLYEHFVEKDNGIIFAVINEQEVEAFLSCYSVSEGIYDVDYIYVMPSKRDRGYGTELIKAYSQNILSQGSIPIYNHAVTEQSAQAATKAGFEIIRTVYSCRLNQHSS